MKTDRKIFTVFLTIILIISMSIAGCRSGDVSGLSEETGEVVSTEGDEQTESTGFSRDGMRPESPDGMTFNETPPGRMPPGGEPPEGMG